MIQLWAVLLLSQASAHASIGLLMQHFTGEVINVTDRLARMLRMSAKSASADSDSLRAGKAY